MNNQKKLALLIESMTGKDITILPPEEVAGIILETMESLLDAFNDLDEYFDNEDT